MADVYTVVFSVIGILLTGPALLVTLNLLWPAMAGRASARLNRTPGWCVVMGVPVAAAMGLWIAIANQINWGPVRASAWVVGVAGVGLVTIGAAGMVRMLSERLATLSAPTSRLHNLVRGAAVYALALVFPIVGWFLLAPLMAVACLGAAVFAVLRWVPRPQITVVDQSAPNDGYERVGG